MVYLYLLAFTSSGGVCYYAAKSLPFTSHDEAERLRTVDRTAGHLVTTRKIMKRPPESQLASLPFISTCRAPSIDSCKMAECQASIISHTIFTPYRITAVHSLSALTLARCLGVNCTSIFCKWDIPQISWMTLPTSTTRLK